MSNLGQIKQNANDTEKSATTLGKALKLGVAAASIRKIYNESKELSKQYVNLIETNNLFEVSMGRVVDEYGNLDKEASKYYTKAAQFQDTMNEKLATNEEELKRYQAMYYSMFKAQNINKDASYLMSESLTKAGYDIASLYNLETTQAVEKIRAGIAGQVEPLRAIGIDISESALSRVLNEAGIERSVQQLSYAEKEVARYIAIVNQASQAQGDFARTFEQPANQAKVLKNQLIELSQVAGSFLVNAFGGALKVINAVIMAIKEVLLTIASLFGWNLSTSGGVASPLSEIDDSAAGVASNLGNATKKAKEFKRQLMGFDEINNITLPNNTSSSGSGGASGIRGVDSKLLDSLKEWQNGMEKLNGEAQKLRDKILDFFGFTRDINGNLKWSFNHMNKIVKIVGTLVGIIAGIALVGKLIKTAEWIGKIVTAVKGGKVELSAFSKGIVAIIKLFKGEALTAVETMALGLTSVITLIASLAGSYTIMKKFSEGLISAENAMGLLQVTTAGACLSGAALGALIGGPIGAAIGLLIGGLASAVAAYAGFQDETDKSIAKSKELIKEIEKLNDEYSNSKDAIASSANAKLLDLQYAEEMRNKLSALVDENGKIKKGYEDRADFILGELNEALGTEYKRNGEVIQNYQDMQKEIDGIIEKKKQEIKLEAYKDMYKEAIKKQIEDQKNYNEALSETKTAQSNVNEAAKEWQTWINPIKMHKLTEANEKAKQSLEDSRIALQNSTNDAAEFELQIDNLTRGILDNSDTISTSMTQVTQTTIDNIVKLGQEGSSNFIGELDKMNDETQLKILAQMTTVETLTPQVQDKWSKLAKSSETEFVSNISLIPADAEAAILQSITNTEGLTDTTKKAWENLASKSYEKFDEYISKIPDDVVKANILRATTTTTELTPSQVRAWKNLAENSESEYKIAIDNVEPDVKNAIERAISATYSKTGPMENAGRSVGSSGRNGLSSGLGDAHPIASNFLEGFIVGISNATTIGRIVSIVGGIGRTIVNTFNSSLGNHSPSHLAFKSANFYLQGFEKGILDEKNNVLKQVKTLGGTINASFNDSIGLSNGIAINPQDYTVNTNSLLDYGEIKGNIGTSTNIEMKNNLVERLSERIAQTINDKNINVEVTAKTEKGTIVETAVNGIKEYTNRTGSLPFPVPV